MQVSIGQYPASNTRPVIESVTPNVADEGTPATFTVQAGDPD